MSGRDEFQTLALGNQLADATERMLGQIFPQYAMPVVKPIVLSDAEKIKRLRSALHGMIDLVASFEDVILRNDIPKDEADAEYESEMENARLVLLETTP